MLQVARISTLGGSQKEFSTAYNQKLEEETKHWLAQKKQLEKSIVQANLNYRCIEEIMGLVESSVPSCKRLKKYQQIL